MDRTRTAGPAAAVGLKAAQSPHARSRAAKSIIFLLGVDPGVGDRLRRQAGERYEVRETAGADQLYRLLQHAGAAAGAVVLGLAIENPVRVAQRVCTIDKHIPIVILCRPGQSAQLKRTLMFSPFLGSEVTPWSTSELDELPAGLRALMTRREQRLRYASTISTAQIRLEKLPLLQPEATHYLDQLLDHAPIGVLTVDLSGTLLTLNRQAQTTLGVGERTALGRLLGDFFPDRERQRLDDLLTRNTHLRRRQKAEIFEIEHGAASISYVEVSPAPLAYRTGQRGSMLILEDVSDRVQAEIERRRAEDELRSYATVLRAFHEISSAQSLKLADKLHRLLKLGCDQLGMPTGILSRIDGDCFEVQDSVTDNPAFARGTVKSVAHTYCGATVTAREPVAFEHAAQTQWRNHHGYRVHGLEAYIGVPVLVDGEPYGTLCFASNAPREQPFTAADREVLKLMSQWVGGELQRERAEALMHKLSGAVQQTADSVIITDRDRFIEYVNPAFEKLTGYAPEEVIGHKTYFLRSGVHDQGFYDELRQVIENGGVFRGVIVNRKKDGTIYYEQKTISPLKDSQGRITHFISTGHDITDLVKAEEMGRIRQDELAHVARLSTLGEMTSGLAHELNQPLCAITTYAQTCLRVLQREDWEPEEIRYGLIQVVRQAEISGEIFRRLRNFARKGDLRRRRVILADIIDEVAGFIRADANQQMIRIRIELDDDVPEVLADPIQIEQVLLNLARNSMDALAAVGTERREIAIRGSRHDEGWARVEIIDSGPGCPADVADRLFEPFFTTKPNGLGIGLGISQSIIEAHGGKLWLDANSQQGARFCFTLPREEDSIPQHNLVSMQSGDDCDKR